MWPLCGGSPLYVAFVRGQSLGRLLLSYLSAVALPWVYVSVWYGFFVEDGTFRQFLADYGGGLVPSLPVLSGMELQTAIYLSLLAIIGFRSVVHVVSKGHERNKAQKNAFGLSVALSVFILILELLFGGSLPPSSIIVAAVPFSFAVFDFLSNGRRIETNILLSLLLLAAVLLRVSEFLNF